VAEQLGNRDVLFACLREFRPVSGYGRCIVQPARRNQLRCQYGDQPFGAGKNDGQGLVVPAVCIAVARNAPVQVYDRATFGINTERCAHADLAGKRFCKGFPNRLEALINKSGDLDTHQIAVAT